MLALRLAVVLTLCAGCPIVNPAWDGLASTSGTSHGDGASSSGDTTSTGGPTPSAGCMPLPSPDAGATIVAVDPSQSPDLDELVAAAAPNTTFVLADGTYDRVGQPSIIVTAAGVVLRSASGDPDGVVLDGGFEADDLVTIRADDVTVAELSVRSSGDDLIAVDPAGLAGVRGTVIHRVHFRDAANFQLVLEAEFAAGAFADDGEVSCSSFALTDAFRDQMPSCEQASAIKGFAASGWTVRDNTIDDVWCPDSASFIAVHFGYGAADTVIERNRFRDVYRGLMLGFETDTLGARPPPPGSSCPAGAQHIGGSIRNNMVWIGGPGLAAASVGVDAMISVWSACDVDVQHNTMVSLFPVFSTLEYRFSDTSGSIVNNLLTGEVLARDPAAIVDAGNLEDVGAELFVDPGAGDLHLAPSAAAAIDASVVAGAAAVADDFDAEPRDAAPDVGADEIAS